MPQLRIHPRRAFGGGFGIIGGGGALMYMDGLGVQKNRGPTKLLELSWATASWDGHRSAHDAKRTRRSLAGCSVGAHQRKHSRI